MSLISAKEAKKVGSKSDVTEGTAVDVGCLHCLLETLTFILIF